MNNGFAETFGTLDLVAVTLRQESDPFKRPLDWGIVDRTCCRCVAVQINNWHLREVLSFRHGTVEMECYWTMKVAVWQEIAR